MPFDSGNVMLVEGDQLAIKVWRGYDAYVDPQLLAEVRFDLESELTSALVVRRGKPLMISDAQNDPRWQIFKVSEHIHSWLGVPLYFRQQVIGLFSLDRTSPCGFSEEEIALAQSFASHASIALENASLFEAAEKRAAELEALRQASLILTASLDLPAVLDAILESVLGLLPDVNNGHIFLYNPENGGQLSFGASLMADGRRGILVAEPREDGLTYTVARSGKVILVPDMRVHPLFEGAPPDWNGAIIGLPLKIGQQVVGVMNISYVRPRTFSEDEMRLLRLLGDQAAIAIENARLFEALERRVEEAETLRHAGATVAATLDLDESIERILQQLHQVVPYDSASVQLFSGDSLEIVGGRGLLQQGEVIGMRFPLAPGDPGYEVFEKRQPCISEDIQTEYPTFADKYHGHIHGWMGVPLIVKDRFIGMITLDSTQAGAFTPEHGRLASAFADQVAIALENARLFERAATERLHLGLLYDIGRGVASSLDPDEILEIAINLTCQGLAGYMGEAFRYLADEDRLYMSALYGRPEVSLEGLNTRIVMRPGLGLAGWVAQEQQPVNVPDIEDDGRWFHVEGVDDGVRAVISAPITFEERLLGVLSVMHHQPAYFSDDQLDLLQAICQGVGLALSNAYRYQEVQRRLMEITLIQSLAQTFNQRLEVQVLLDEVATQLANRMGYPKVRIFLVEEDELVLKATHGPQPLRERYKISEGIIGRVARAGQAVFLPDVSRDPDFIGHLDRTVAELAVPIFREKSVVGVINLESGIPGQLTKHDREIIEVLAGQVSVALENAILYERVSRHAQDLESTVARRTLALTELYELSQQIGYALSPNDLLRLLVNHLQKAVRSEIAGGCLLLENNCPQYIESQRPMAPEMLDRLKTYHAEIISRWDENVALDGEQNLEIVANPAGGEDRRPIVRLRTLLHAPLVAGQKLVGILTIGSEKPNAFSHEHKRLLETFAHQGATAIERLAALKAAEQKRLEGLFLWGR